MSSPQFRTVPREEMAFALRLFVQAANQRMGPQAQPADLHAEEDGCASLFDSLCADRDEAPQVTPRPSFMALMDPLSASPAGHETTLYVAFQALCHFYVNDPLQAAICARVLAFYFLMEHSRGAAINGWLQPSGTAPELVILHPVVVEAIATVTLRGNATLSATTLAQKIATLMTEKPQTH